MSFYPNQEPFYRPQIPFTGAIHGGFYDGKLVVVQGQVKNQCDRFHVNFQCGSSVNPRADVAFHFNPRFDDNDCVVCNTFQNQSWGQEERKYEMPFKKGHFFEILFLTRANSFMVAVNGNHFLEYKHRIPLSRVDTIAVSGQVDVESISFRDSRVNPGFPAAAALPSCYGNPVFSAAAVQPPCYGSPGLISAAVQPPNYAAHGFPSVAGQVAGFGVPGFPAVSAQAASYTIPYKTVISGGLYPSRSITVTGSVPNYAVRFHIDLKTQFGIAFHLNPRFEKEENTIVRNSFLNNGWGPEERSLPNSRMPILRGESFMIWILCEPRCFKVSVNGQHMFNYNHRVSDLQSIQALEIHGDVQLTSVQV